MTDPADPYNLLGAARAAADLLDEMHSSEGARYGQYEATRKRLAEAIALAAPLAKRVWTPAELAAAWQVSVSTVRGWIDDGELEAFNVGRGSVPHWRVLNAGALRFAELRRARPREGS